MKWNEIIFWRPLRVFQHERSEIKNGAPAFPFPNILMMADILILDRKVANLKPEQRYSWSPACNNENQQNQNYVWMKMGCGYVYYAWK